MAIACQASAEKMRVATQVGRRDTIRRGLYRNCQIIVAKKMHLDRPSLNKTIESCF